MQSDGAFTYSEESFLVKVYIILKVLHVFNLRLQAGPRMLKTWLRSVPNVKISFLGNLPRFPGRCSNGHVTILTFIFL